MKYCVWIIVYIALVTVSIYETEKERRRVRRILTNGKCIEGVIDRLQEIRRETIFNRWGHVEETSAYRIVVKVQGEYDSIRYFYSDEISRWKKNHISPRVKIYDDMEDIYIEYEKTKEKIHYEIEKNKGSYEGTVCERLFRYYECSCPDRIDWGFMFLFIFDW